MPPTLSEIIPYVCGLSSKVRQRRRFIMASVYIDDSANSTNEPFMWMAGWVGHLPDWNGFPDAWDEALAADNPKPIGYFKHTEARVKKGCFAGFSEAEANEKMLSMADVVTKHELYGVTCFIDRAVFSEMVKKYAIEPIQDNLKDPLYICILSVMSLAMGVEFAAYPNEKIDFIFDGTPASSQAIRIVDQFEKVRNNLPEYMQNQMGTATPMNDKTVRPLQAADLLAGQSRLTLLKGNYVIPEPLRLIRERMNVFTQTLRADTLFATIQEHNRQVRALHPRVIEIERSHKGRRGDEE